MPTKNNIEFGPGLLYVDDEKFAELTEISGEVETETEWAEDVTYIPKIADQAEFTIECDTPFGRGWELVYCRQCHSPFPITQFYSVAYGSENWLCPVCTAVKRMKERIV